MKPYTLLTFFILTLGILKAQTPNMPFGVNGVMFTDCPCMSYGWASGGGVIGYEMDALGGFAIQADGKIVTTGTCNSSPPVCDAWIGRHNSDGSIDTSFGTNGWVSLRAIASQTGNFIDSEGITIQPDGKIIIVGRANQVPGEEIVIFASRLNSAGSIDTTFATSGMLYTSLVDTNSSNARCVTLQPDGKIIIGGGSRYVGQYNWLGILRLNTDGTPDSTFNSTGKVIHSAPTESSSLGKVLIQPDGKIIGIGSYDQGVNVPIRGLILRYNPNGSADNTFGTNGVATTNYGQYFDRIIDALILQDGKILMCGETDNKYYLARLNSDGSVDSTFGANGIKAENLGYGAFCTSLAMHSNGNIVSHGWGNTYDTNFNFSFISLFMVHTYDGQRNTVFANNGLLEVDITGGFNDNPVGMYPLHNNIFVCAGIADDDDTLHSMPERDYYLYQYIIDLTIGLIEFSRSNSNVLIYPNPLQANETLKYTLVNNENISISMMDSQGKLVAEFVKNKARNKGDNIEILTLPENLLNGTYFIEIASPKGRVSIKVVK